MASERVRYGHKLTGASSFRGQQSSYEAAVFLSTALSLKSIIFAHTYLSDFFSGV
jgi:hypothetical protein